MRVAIESNAATVADLFRTISALTPDAARRVLMDVSLAARKDIRNSIRGKGPIAVSPQSPTTLKWKAKQGLTRSLGGKMPDFIARWNDNNGAYVGVRRERLAYFEKFQRGFPSSFGVSKKDAANTWQFFGDMTDDKKKKRLLYEDYWRWKSGFPLRNFPGLRIPSHVPARPVIGPYSEWSGLHDRLAKTMVQTLARMFKRSVQKAA